MYKCANNNNQKIVDIKKIKKEIETMVKDKFDNIVNDLNDVLSNIEERLSYLEFNIEI